MELSLLVLVGTLGKGSGKTIVPFSDLSIEDEAMKQQDKFSNERVRKYSSPSLGLRQGRNESIINLGKERVGQAV